jgi:hypothetical protein
MVRSGEPEGAGIRLARVKVFNARGNVENKKPSRGASSRDFSYRPRIRVPVDIDKVSPNCIIRTSPKSEKEIGELGGIEVRDYWPRIGPMSDFMPEVDCLR